jgi:hypothetical protein
MKKTGYHNQHITPVDHHLAQAKRDLDHLEWDDPEFDVVQARIVEAYSMIARGESHVVSF